MNDLESLSSLFNNKIFRIPNYQRGYAWERKKLDDFWEDLITLPNDRFHYKRKERKAVVDKAIASLPSEDLRIFARMIADSCSFSEIGGMFIIKFKPDTCLIRSKARMLPVILIQEICFRITILAHRCFFAPFMIIKTNSMSHYDNSCAGSLCSKFVRHL